VGKRTVNKDPHNQIEYRLLILLFGAIMLTGGKSLWVNIVGGVFVAYGVLRILYKDVYKAMRSA
jgi:hypothetical protein